MNYSLDNYNTFIITSANIKYLGINIMKDMKDFCTYTKTETKANKQKNILYNIIKKNLNSYIDRESIYFYYIFMYMNGYVSTSQ